MDGSIALSRGERKRLLEVYRTQANAQLRLRAHILLLLGDGYAWSVIAAVLFCSSATIARWKQRYCESGLDAVFTENRGRVGTLLTWSTLVILWVRGLTPWDLGYCRTRWCCATLALVLWDTNHVKVSAETVRRMLHQQGMVWRRPRPVLKPKDAKRPAKLRKIRELLRDLPEDEAALIEDEVDLNLNPELGCMWMEQGQQACVETPGTNVKRYVAGSMSWRTGRLTVTQGDHRSAELFVRHLEEIRLHFARFRRIHIICDNARFHTIKGSKAVRAYLEQWGQQVILHYLPTYSPKDNPIERVWWHLREEVTRNHQCQSINELVDLTLKWIEDRGRFKIEGGMYQRLLAKRAAA